MRAGGSLTDTEAKGTADKERPMATQPPNKPDTIEPGAPPERPPSEPEPAPGFPPETEPASPDIDQPLPGPEELPPD